MVALGQFLLAAGPAQAAYPGADGLIVFVRTNQIFTISANGTGLTQLTDRNQNFRPVWSPNGHRIAFIKQVGTSKDLWVMRADGTHKHQLTHLGSVYGPSWSPNGQRLAFGSPTLQIVHATWPYGSTPHAVLAAPFVGDPLQTWDVDGRVAWSPDGVHLAFYAHDFPDSPDNYLLVLNRSQKTVREYDAIGGSCCGEGYFADPAFSPDGVTLAYTVKIDLSDGVSPRPPYVNFTSFAGTAPAFPQVDGDQQVAFAPADDRVVLLNNNSGSWNLEIANVDGSGRHVLTGGYNPDWQPVVP